MITSAADASDNSNDKKPASMLSHLKYEHLLAGVSAGLTSTLVLHPLDLLKIRFAVNDGQVTRPQYTGLGNAVVTILKEEGIQGLYRGVGPNCWGAGTAWGFYFLFYNSIKTWMLETKRKKELNAGEHMLAAAEAGTLNLVMTNPIWVVKTRMCLQYANCNETVPASKVYLGTFDALCKIYRYEGIKGLYKGFVPGVFGVSHGALQFMAYEEMKKYYLNNHRHRPDKKMGTLEYLSFAALSKLFAASITYPYQVVRARLQDQHKVYNGVIDVLTRTWRCEGMTGFFKGLLPSLLRVTPATAITFVVYEHTSQFLLRDK